MKTKKIITIIVISIMVFISTPYMFCRKGLPSAMETRATAELQDAFCTKHQIPIKECFFCNSSLREPGRLWCEKHERYEDRCFICHPELKEENRLWCEGHKLYEDECFFCHPELREAQNALERKDTNIPMTANVRAVSSKELQCVEHGVLEKECGICHPELIDTLLTGQGLKIRLESPRSAKKAGISTAVPTLGPPLTSLKVLGKVTYDQNRFARITPLADGVIQKVLVDVGDSVSNGQLLAEVASPEIAKVKSDYLSAIAAEALKKVVFEREKELVEKRISSQQEYEQALAEYQMAKSAKDAAWQQLLNYGLTKEQIRTLEELRSGSSLLFILAPFTGTLVSRNAVIGEAVKPGDTLFELTDISSMWIELSIPEDRLSLVKVNDPIEATFDVLPGVSVRGRLIWLSSSIDEQTRMMKARAVVPNADSMLKHGMFGQISLLSERSSGVLFAPVDALHKLNEKPFVFLKLSDDLYEARRVVVGSKDGGNVEILEGISPHEELVVNHSFTLKSEFLKSRLGAGCVDE
jgi:cobalt-zinc-cadmium efflux system membrane fusion protein